MGGWNKGLTKETSPKIADVANKLRKKFDPYLLQDLYYRQNMTMQEIAEMLGCSIGTVCRRFKEYNIPARTPDQTMELRGVINSGRFRKGQIAHNKGISPSPESVEKRRQKLLGRSTWNKGKPMHEWIPEESNQIRKEKIKKNNPRYWEGKKRSTETIEKIKSTKANRPSETKEAILRNWLRSIHYRPNKSEQKLIEFFASNNLPYEYVGDGKIIIDGLCPDFINCNGEKKIIELFDECFHHPDEKQTRASRFAKYRFKMMVIWHKELCDMNKVLMKVKRFTEDS